jgi:hypothetical protein
VPPFLNASLPSLALFGALFLPANPIRDPIRLASHDASDGIMRLAFFQQKVKFCDLFRRPASV